MMNKKWSALFSKEISQKMKKFNSSISFDYKLAKYDVIGTIIHLKMLNKIAIFNDDELNKALTACENLLIKIQKNELEFYSEAEDIHFFIQSELQKEIEDLAKKIHTGRSRNDQVVLDLILYTRDQVDTVSNLAKKVIHEMLKIAEKNLHTLLPAYTHLQQAQPTSLAHYFCCYIEMLNEDINRLEDFRKRVNKCPLGSSSICGSSLSLDRDFIAKELGFDGLIENSMNAISNRDFIIEFCSITSILMMHLSRFCEDIVIYSSNEFGFFILDDAFCTGSSLMPNKKNPDLLELIRGKTGRIFGNLNTILTIMKGLPISYNKDMQEDKKSLFENAEITIECLDILSEFLPTLKFNKDKMKEKVINSYCLATDLLDYLVLKNAYFKDAHEIMAKMTNYCITEKKWFYELKLEEFKQFSDKFESDVFEVLKEENILSNHKTIGSPNPEMVKKFIKRYYEKM